MADADMMAQLERRAQVSSEQSQQSSIHEQPAVHLIRKAMRAFQRGGDVDNEVFKSPPCSVEQMKDFFYDSVGETTSCR
jgi:hypothetical protein